LTKNLLRIHEITTQEDMISFSLTTKVHMALILGNSFWGVGAIVGALGLATTHPVAFLMIRQLLAGLLLLAGASYFAISSPTTVVGDDDDAAKTSRPRQHLNLDTFRLRFKQHWKLFALVGLTLFGSQFGKSYYT
jgi:drug/metabolite transporter (DMT)-like permease